MSEKNVEFTKDYQKFAQSVYRFCMFKLNNKEQSEDITSEVFIDFYKTDFNKISNKKAWLFTVARNKVNDQISEKYTRSDTNTEDAEINNFEIDKKHMEDLVLENELVNIVKDKIKELDSLSAEIVILRVWEDLSFSQIAEITEITAVNARKKFQRAIEKIRAEVVEEERESKLKAISIPVVFAGILQIGNSADLTLDNSQLESILNQVASILNIKFTVMNTNSNLPVASKTASTAGKSGILSTTSGKLAIALIGGTILLGAGATGGYFLAEQNDTNNEDEIVKDKEDIQSRNEEDVSEKQDDVNETEEEANDEELSIEKTQDKLLVNSNGEFAFGKPFPEEVKNLYDDELQRINDVKGFYLKNNEYVEIKTDLPLSNTRVIDFVDGRTKFIRLAYIELQDGEIIVIYDQCNEKCGGGMGTHFYFGYLNEENQVENEVSVLNPVGPYPVYGATIGLTIDNTLYFTAYAGDAMFAASSLVKVNLNTGDHQTLKTCTEITTLENYEENNVETSTEVSCE